MRWRKANYVTVTSLYILYHMQQIIPSLLFVYGLRFMVASCWQKKPFFCPCSHSVSPVSHPHFSHTHLPFAVSFSACSLCDETTRIPEHALGQGFVQEYKSDSWEREKVNEACQSHHLSTNETEGWEDRKRRICFHEAAVNPSLVHSGISAWGGGVSTSAGRVLLSIPLLFPGEVLSWSQRGADTDNSENSRGNSPPYPLNKSPAAVQ